MSDPVVVVRILDIDPAGDLEGDDDFVPFYDNHADIYGTVTIDGHEFALPKIAEDDHPHWDKDGDRSGVFAQPVTSNPVPISIDIWEADSGSTGDDDHVDINPRAGKRRLDVEFDLCANTIDGDVSGAGQDVISATGTGDAGATVNFTVALEGLPPTTDDLALMHVGLIQVVPMRKRLVARKGIVAAVRIANTFASEQTTSVRLRIQGSGVSVDRTQVVTLPAGVVVEEHLFTDDPIELPTAADPYEVALLAEIDDPGSAALAADDCRRRNDRVQQRIIYTVVTTPRDFSMLWAKVGTLLDVGNYAPDTHIQEIHELGTPFIEATFPLRDPISDVSPLPIPPPGATAATEFLLSVLSGFPYSPTNVEPVLFTFELNAIAALTGYDRLMGVLPNKDWFTRFDLWDGVNGFSLGQFASRAVIFVPRYPDDDGVVGVPMTLPAHELGHTFGLSTDSRLKRSWVCDIDWPVIGSAGCGLVGGFDEYEHDDETLRSGNPADGYWVATGNEPASLTGIDGMVDARQDDSHCVMGGVPVDPHLAWQARRRWIDAADYDRLIDRLKVHDDPEVIYLSGMISFNDQVHLGPWYRFAEGVPDHTATAGMYELRFVDRDGAMLGHVGIPVAWNHAEFARPLPITFFAVTAALPRGTVAVEVRNRGTGRLLATGRVDQEVPNVRLRRPTATSTGTDLSWSASPPRGLRFSALVSADGRRWWPVAHDVEQTTCSVETAQLPTGRYRAKVVAVDGTRVGESNEVAVEVR